MEYKLNEALKKLQWAIDDIPDGTDGRDELQKAFDKVYESADYAEIKVRNIEDEMKQLIQSFQ